MNLQFAIRRLRPSSSPQRLYMPVLKNTLAKLFRRVAEQPSHRTDGTEVDLSQVVAAHAKTVIRQTRGYAEFSCLKLFATLNRNVMSTLFQASVRFSRVTPGMQRATANDGRDCLALLSAGAIRSPCSRGLFHSAFGMHSQRPVRSLDFGDEKMSFRPSRSRVYGLIIRKMIWACDVGSKCTWSANLN